MRPQYTLVPGLVIKREPFQETRLREQERLVLPDAAPQPHETARPAVCAGGVDAGSEVTVARLERALQTVAVLLIEDEVYLPIFERLEKELTEARKTADTLDRARRIARASRAHKAAR